ncbi:MAG: oligosaccharide flippase family protein [Verrucomicrobiota bacterium]|jgi:O-antigen/teichoic acid export membrane protein
MTSVKPVLDALCPAVLRTYKARIEASPLGYRLARGAFWSLIGTVLSRSLSVVSSILVARMLGKVGMGELGIIQSTVGIFSAFAGLGMGLTATKFVAEYRAKDPRRAGAVLGLSASVSWASGAVMSLAMFVLAPWFAQHTLAAPQLAGMIRVGSVLLLIGSVNGAQTGALAGFEAFKTIARLNLICGLLSFPLMVGGTWWLGLVGAVWGLNGSVAVNCLFSHLALRREAAAAGVPFSATLQPNQWGMLWRFSLPSVLCNVIFGPANWACSALLVNRPNGYAEMGVFNVALSWFNAVSFLPGVLALVILPVLSSQAAEAGYGSQKKIVALAIRANAIAVIPVALFIACVSPLIMSFYGAGFREGWPTLVVTVVTAAILAVQVPLAQAITASGRMWIMFFTHVSYGVLYFGLTFAMVEWGALGLSTARLFAYIVNAVWVWWFASKYIWADTRAGTMNAASPPESA